MHDDLRKGCRSRNFFTNSHLMRWRRKPGSWVRRRPDGVQCAHCDSTRIVERTNRRSLRHWCHDRRRYFFVNTHSVMHRSPLSWRIWVAAVYLMLTNLKGAAHTKLSREFGISQKSAWHLSHGIRAAFAQGQDRHMLGPIEVDETYSGGKAKNQHASQCDGKRGEINYRTASLWRHCFLAETRGLLPVRGVVEVDAIFFAESAKGDSSLRKCRHPVNVVFCGERAAWLLPSEPL